jgi:plastocyanin domain-containing protein
VDLPSLVAALSGLVLLMVALLLYARSGRGSHRAKPGPDGVQEVEIVVLDGYKPDRVLVRDGYSVRLKFTRLEDNECSGRVLFSDFKLERRLPAFRTTVVEFLPPGPGEYLFTCGLGMYQGKLIVRAWSHRSWRRPGRGEASRGVAKHAS